MVEFSCRTIVRPALELRQRFLDGQVAQFFRSGPGRAGWILTVKPRAGDGTCVLVDLKSFQAVAALDGGTQRHGL